MTPTTPPPEVDALQPPRNTFKPYVAYHRIGRRWPQVFIYWDEREQRSYIRSKAGPGQSWKTRIGGYLLRANPGCSRERLMHETAAWACAFLKVYGAGMDRRGWAQARRQVTEVKP